MKKVYICSSLRQDNYNYVTELLKKLPEAIHLRPHISQSEADDKRHFVESDVAMMEYADEIWVLGRFGRDCSWEIGYATGRGIPIKLLEDKYNAEVLAADWMWIHGKVLNTLIHYTTIEAFRRGLIND